MLLTFFMLYVFKFLGKGSFEFAEVAIKGINWSMIIMLMCIYPFMTILSNPDSGITAFLTSFLAPVFNDISAFWFFAATLVITVLLTNLTVNVIVAVLMMTFTLPIAVSLGIAPVQVVYLPTISCTIAFLVPSSGPGAMLLFTNKQWMKTKDVYLYAIPTVILLSVIALVVNLLVFAF